jgi:hypothetical protein
MAVVMGVVIAVVAGVMGVVMAVGAGVMAVVMAGAGVLAGVRGGVMGGVIHIILIIIPTILTMRLPPLPTSSSRHIRSQHDKRSRVTGIFARNHKATIHT